MEDRGSWLRKKGAVAREWKDDHEKRMCESAPALLCPKVARKSESAKLDCEEDESESWSDDTCTGSKGSLRHARGSVGFGRTSDDDVGRGSRCERRAAIGQNAVRRRHSTLVGAFSAELDRKSVV